MLKLEETNGKIHAIPLQHRRSNFPPPLSFFFFHLFSHLKTDEMMPALRRRSRCNILERILRNGLILEMGKW